jgi:hypothetical protein
MSSLLIILLFIFVFGGIAAFPIRRYRARWGYGPSGIFGLVLLAMIVMALLESPA